MKPISNFFFLCSLALTLAVLPHPILADGASDLVQQVCARTQNRQSCLTTLQSEPDSKTANLDELGVIATKLARALAEQIAERAKEVLLNKTSLGPENEQAVRDCVELYEDAVSQLDSANAALLSHAYSDLSLYLATALADAETCEMGFSKPGLLTEYHTKFSQLCDTASAISRQLDKK
ncbi:hypothetical protein Tsubulata_039874 [Turnera subulata]|uniref:Pectinesterase inhibitor domain-containing protein n=1 Tax=Turnera subulata TaxID=218843 RepID=A0A9Q0J831_9ROSI|nr:hypothetical protein Tsubulata_039874 [Turnera subulata]